MKYLQSAAIGLFFFTSTVAATPAEFNGTTGVLTIPEVSVGGQVYRNARLLLENATSLTFRLVGIEDPLGQCSESNINFTRYVTLPSFHTIATDAELNALIGCAGTVTTADSTFRTLRWSLPTSTASCPRYIEVRLVSIGTAMGMLGQEIVGINSETNLPRSCG